MMSGYYGAPLFRRPNQYVPQGSISAFVNRDTVATNTYAGGALDIPREEIPIQEHSGVESYTDSTETKEFTGHDATEETLEGSYGPSMYHSNLFNTRERGKKIHK